MGCDVAWIAWAAGFLDGEGYFHLQPVKRRADRMVNRKPMIQAAQTRREPLERLQSLFGGWIMELGRRPDRLQTWRWDISGSTTVSPALLSMLPYLTVKKTQAALLLEYCELMGNRGKQMLPEIAVQRDDIYNQLMAARQGGHLGL